MASLGELFIQLAFEGDTKGAENFQKSLKETEKNANKMISVMKDLANKNLLKMNYPSYRKQLTM